MLTVRRRQSAAPPGGDCSLSLFLRQGPSSPSGYVFNIGALVTTCVNIKTSLTESVSNAALHRAVIRVIALNGFTEKEKTKKKKGALFFPKQNWFGLL